jgi:integration host factor subunit alpha
MAGINDVSMNPRCPHCSRPLHLGQYIPEVFKRILEKLEKGEDVRVAGFGSFSARFIKERKLPYLVDGMEKIMKSRRVIRFRASPKAKASVNNAKVKAKKASK